MATVTPKRLVDPLQLATSASSTLYSPTSGVTAIVKEIVLSNPTANAATVSVFLVPTGGSAGNSTAIVPGITLSGNSFVTIPLSQVLNYNDKLQALASAATTITMTASGVEYA